MPEDSAQVDPERGLGIIESFEMREEPQSEASSNRSPEVNGIDQKERRDFDDGANALWSLYWKEVKTHDEARVENVAKITDGVLVFAGMLSAVLASFLLQSLQTLQVNPMDQSVYYQNQSAYYQQQSVAMLAQISQQIASIALQASVSCVIPQTSTPSPISQSSVPSIAQQVSPPPYPAFKPSPPDVRVNACWVVALVCSLSAALLAILTQQWVQSYMQVFQRYDHPLKRARFRQFFFEGSNGIWDLAKQVTRLIDVSLFLFFLGFCDCMRNTNTFVGVTTIVPICWCGVYYLYNVTTHLADLQSPHETLLSRATLFLAHMCVQLFNGKWRPLKQLEAYREESMMDEKGRKLRDVRAVRWLVEHTAANAEMEPLVLAIPGSFNTEWGREVWIDVYNERSDPSSYTLEPQIEPPVASDPAPLIHHSRFPEGTACDTIRRSVRYLFETCNNPSYFTNGAKRHRRMRACVEAAASLVCCTDFQLDWFGEVVVQVVSELGRTENINEPPTTVSDQSFIIRWTCLSLVAVQQILNSNRLRERAGYAVSGMARFQSKLGPPDESAWTSAERIEECLKTAWNRAEELHQALEPWNQKKTRENVEEILRNHERQISGLESIKAEADGMEDIDKRITLYQDAMDHDTHSLTRELPGVSFDEPRPSESLLLSDTVSTRSASVTPQLIFPGQQVRALARLGQRLREVLNGQVTDGYEEVLESLKSVDQVSLSLRQPNGLIKRQLWRLQDLRDGGGFGFTIELFFLSLRRLLSIPSLHGSSSILHIGTFKAITSNWEEIKDSLGTHQILLSLICDLIIRDRGIFSGFLYPEPITTMLVDTLGNILQAYVDPDWQHIYDAMREIMSVESGNCMNMSLQHKVLVTLRRFYRLDA